jgi:two-component system phosphate regulon sensor histidine kinase PhoR
MRSDFVANASHELRTPLASLKGFVETLRGAAKDDPVARERFLAIMQEQADRMAQLIDDLLSLSRIEIRQHVRPEGSVDLLEIATRAAGDLSPKAGSNHIALNIHRPTGPVVVRGERDELYQLVHNLLENAIKYGRLGGKVDVTLAAEGPRIAMAVQDDGIGIAPEHLPRLTERFYRVSAKASRERGGTGLGLAIVKHIVTRHQGDLDIRSEPDKGSIFTVRLPANVPAVKETRE